MERMILDIMRVVKELGELGGGMGIGMEVGYFKHKLSECSQEEGGTYMMPPSTRSICTPPGVYSSLLGHCSVTER